MLSYQLDDTDGYWIQGDESGPYIDSRLPICRQPNCTVNINRTLTNDDSGWYYYVTSANPTNKQTPYVIVKVLGEQSVLLLLQWSNLLQIAELLTVKD